ncbi:hypothetical protein AVEN_161094-1 [Araneus ventricosus]|uniref:Uncharacterized protein n=1 Tax=Araneus ventricosus TaxID=182803 RepID=A0A4Y2W1D7_ARAVE|nr:hypothetical protein AVEN_161094-1 [Araneus ventricosus]
MDGSKIGTVWSEALLISWSSLSVNVQLKRCSAAHRSCFASARMFRDYRRTECKVVQHLAFSDKWRNFSCSLRRQSTWFPNDWPPRSPDSNHLNFQFGKFPVRPCLWRRHVDLPELNVLQRFLGINRSLVNSAFIADI